MRRYSERVQNDPYGSYVPGLMSNGPDKETQYKRRSLELPTLLQREGLSLV